MTKADLALLCGLGADDIVRDDDLGCELHRQVVEPLRALQRQAAAEQIELRVVSGYRSCARQLAIWNGKVRGERPVFDDRGRRVDMACLSERQQLFAILRWSALPGASRHHWGTEFDICDAAVVADDYCVQLQPAEYAAGGPFAHLQQWLAAQVCADSSQGFFLPYSEDRGGVAAEPWHISFAPLSFELQEQLTPARLREHIETLDVLLKDTLLEHLHEIYERYIAVPRAAYPSLEGRSL